MAHCLSEPFQLKTRCVSSQVAGDSTAHTVTIRSIGFIPEISRESSINSTDSYEPGRAGVSIHREYRPSRTAPLRPRAGLDSLEIEAVHQPCLMALEIHEIEAGSGLRRAPPDLAAPGQ